MTNPDIRMFKIQHGRDGEINYAILCNGRTHYTVEGSLQRDIWTYHPEIAHCDGVACQAQGSEVLDISRLSHNSQLILGLEARVPPEMVLVTKHYPEYGRSFVSGFSSGAEVTPKQLESGTLLTDGEGMTFIRSETGEIFNSSRNVIYYVRNESGNALKWRAGKEGRKRTAKKLAKLRRGERRSEVSYEVSVLNARMLELMQLHRTPEVASEIEDVKDLLRLASSLSLEASIEAAEGNEEIARELANSRAREISSELQDIRDRLTLEQRAREAARKELGR